MKAVVVGHMYLGGVALSEVEEIRVSLVADSHNTKRDEETQIVSHSPRLKEQDYVPDAEKLSGGSAECDVGA